MNLLLKMAIRAGSPNLVRFHLRRGSHANQQDDSGTSPLMYAASRGLAEICQILLDAGADPVLKNRQGQDALDLADIAGHDTVKAMLRAATVIRIPDSDTQAVNNEAVIEELTDSLADALAFDATAWEAEIETPPPESNPDCLDSTRVLHQILSHHVPVDTDADWSDIEIDLPNLPTSRRDRVWAERWANITPVLIQGLQVGRISRADIECALQHDEPDLETQERLLDRILGELSIQVDDWVDEDQDSSASLIDPEEEQPEEQVVDEALRFIEDVLEQRMDQANCYQRDLNAFSLLTKEEEIRLAQRMEAGMDRMLSALAGYPPAVGELLRIYDAIRDHGARLTEVVSGFRDVEEALPPPADMEQLLAADDPDTVMDASEAIMDDANDEQEEETPDDTETGPDPEATIRHFAGLRVLHQQTLASLDAFGLEDPRTQTLHHRLGDHVQQFGLAPKVLDALIARLHEVARRIDALETCRSDHEDGLATQELRAIERETRLPIPMIDQLHRRLSGGVAEARRARDGMIEANLRLVSIAKKYSHRGLSFLNLVKESNINLMKGISSCQLSESLGIAQNSSWQ